MESDIKKKICDYLDANGFYPMLNIVTNRNAIADITVFCPGGRVFMIETKQPGKQLRALQQYRADEMMRKVQVRTFRIDHLEQIKKIIEHGEHLSL